MKHYFIIHISLQTLYLTKVCFSSYVPKCICPVIAGFFKVQYLKKDVRDQVNILHVNRHQNCFGVVVNIPKVPKITSLQYLDKKEARDKYNILNEDDH